MRGSDIGEANSRVIARHPDIDTLVGASTTVSRRRKNPASRLIIRLYQLVVSTRERGDKRCYGGGNSSAGDCDEVVGQHGVLGDAGVSVDLDGLHKSSVSSTNVKSGGAPL